MPPATTSLGGHLGGPHDSVVSSHVHDTMYNVYRVGQSFEVPVMNIYKSALAAFDHPGALAGFQTLSSV